MGGPLPGVIAIGLTGGIGSGKSTVAAHLLARRWKLVTDDIAFIDEAQGTVVGHHGLMRFRSGALPHLPAGFRATLERSRWFVDEDGQLQFYEVDPEAVFGASIWSNDAVLDAVVVLDARENGRAVDGVRATHAAFAKFDGTATLPELFERLRTGAIGRDRAVRVTDRIEHWYDAHVRG